MCYAAAPTRLPDARPHPRVPAGAVAYAILAIAVMAAFRLSWMGDRIVPVGYGVPLVAFAWYRNRRVLWATAAAFALITFLRFFVPVWDNRVPLNLPLRIRAADMALVLIDLMVIAAVVHALIGYRRALERRKAQLQQGFDQAAAREGEIARQNAELQGAGEEAAHLFEEAQQERRRLETVLRATPVGVAVSSAGGEDVRLNPAGASIFGVAPDANIALPDVSGDWRRHHAGVPMEPGQSPLARACRGEEVRDYEMELRLPGGRGVALLVNAVPIRGRDGRVSGSVAAFTDVTALKSLQRELEQRRAEAEEASVRKTEFLAAVSHDIRTPANAITLLAELIRRSASSPQTAADVPELAEELHGSARSLVNLLSDVLDVARLDAGRMEVRQTTFDLAPLFAEQSRQMQPLAREKALALNYVPPAEPMVLRTDRVKLSRVLGNLVGNAIKFTGAGEVTVSAEPLPDGGVAIAVGDTGVGIAAEHQRHVFDEFFQLGNPERDRNKGTGLGLAICSRLVAAMGGRLEVRSTPGEGSVFTITLPPARVAGEGGGNVE